MPASAMCAGVSKSGSPAPRPMMSLPSAFSRGARPVSGESGRRLDALDASRELIRHGTNLQMGRVTAHFRLICATSR